MNLWARPLRVFVLILVGFIIGCRASRNPVMPPEPVLVLPMPATAMRAGPVVGPPVGVRTNLLVKPTRAIFACDVEYSPMVGLYGVFEARTNMNVGRWYQVDAFPYDGQTHYWTNAFANSQQCFVRVGRVWPK